MKKVWLVTLALFVVAAMFADPTAKTPSRYEVVHWQENFESGATGWTHWDGAESPNNWHIYDVGGTQGNCWWMGDPALAQGANIGGYYDHQYLVLDTPAQTITAANTNLTFKMRRNIEDPSGAEDPYTGWDSFNVRISTNGGTTWTPISGTPAYNITSSYAFGFEHGEGPNVPAYGGVLLEWTTATFSLSSYVGQSVMIRFAFASDPAYSTGDAPAMFGVMVDDIAFGSYTNNGVNDGQMTWSSLVPLGGDLWDIATVADAPSPTHAMRNQNATGSYNINMMNYLQTPPIQLPNSGEIRVDFMIKGAFTDPNSWPEVDYFGWEISPNDGITWYAMSNPYGITGIDNFVYSDAPPEWASMCESYTLDGYISDYAGETVMLRWYFKSDADAPDGTGIMIDDVVIYNDIFIAQPENVNATVDGANVVLNWTAPGGGGGGEPGWLFYDSGTNADAIGTGEAADFDVAAKWDPMGDYGIAPWVGMNITKIKFYPNEAACSYAVRVWTGGQANLMVDQAVTPTIGDWNEVILTTPYTIPSGTYLWAGYRCNATTGYPAGVDAGPQVEGYGNMIRLNNAWQTLTEVNAELTYNWNIQIYVEDAAGREYVLGQLPQNEQFTNGSFQASGITTPRMDRDVTAYRVYRDDVLIDEVEGDVYTYTDMNVPAGLHYYYLTAMYGANESTSSNSAIAFILPVGYSEFMNDDDSAEIGYNVGATQQMAAKFSHNHPVTVKYAKIYVHTPGNAGIIVRVFAADAAGGMPGTQLAQYQYPASSILPGWNYVTLPENIDVENGQFFIGILETTNASMIGMDTSSTGGSYKRASGTSDWLPITEGNLMIRAIVETVTAGEDDIEPVVVFDARNYPNPFNPTTTINFSLPLAGHTELKIYNLKGQVVRTLVNQDMASGMHQIVWNGFDNNGKTVSSGVYFYRLTNNHNTLTRKMLLSK